MRSGFFRREQPRINLWSHELAVASNGWRFGGRRFGSQYGMIPDGCTFDRTVAFQGGHCVFLCHNNPLLMGWMRYDLTNHAYRLKDSFQGIHK